MDLQMPANVETAEAPGAAPAPLTLLTFALGPQVYAVDVQRVGEILDMCPISPLPDAPSHILGMIDLRGRAIAIADLARRIGAQADRGATGRIVVFDLRGAEGTTALGIVADRVLRVLEAGRDAIEPVPETRSGWRCDIAEGMVRTDDGIAIVLDIERALCGDALAGAFDFA